MTISNFQRSHPYIPGRYPRRFTNSLLKEFLSLWGFGEVWGIFPGKTWQNNGILPRAQCIFVGPLNGEDSPGHFLAASIFLREVWGNVFAGATFAREEKQFHEVY